MSNSISRLQQEAFGQIVDNPVISKRLAGSLPKFAGLMALALSMGALSIDAHADQKTGQRIAGVLGTLGAVNYMADNRNAGKALAAGAVGAYAGSRIGKGGGATAGAVVGGLLSYGVVAGAQRQREEQQYYQEQQRFQGVNPVTYPGQGYNQGYNGYGNRGNIAANGHDYRNGGYSNGDGYNNRYNNGYNNQNRYPQQRQQVQPRDPILYEVVGQRGFFVTEVNSLSMQQFRGASVGSRSLDEDSQVSRQINVSFHNYANSYRDLDRAHARYQEVAYQHELDNNRVRRQMQYSTDPNGTAYVNQDYNRSNQLNQAINELKRAATDYGVKKGTFFANADNASFEGFNVTPYAEATQYMNPNPEIKAVLNGTQYPKLRQDRVAFSLR